MPLVPELAIAMLACTRIGATHTVIFGGFSADAIRDRVNDCGCKLIVTADGGYRRGSEIKLKPIVDEAAAQTPTVENVVVFKRTGSKVDMQPGRDHWWHEIIETVDADCPPSELDSEHPLYILYTSGTTGKPKGILHTTGGYLTQAAYTTKMVFDLKDEDVYWCTADIGWVTGHSYVVYGPLANGATVFMYEGAPNFPDFDRFWDIIERHKITIFYTAPTAIRAFIKWGEQYPLKHDLSSPETARHCRRADQSRSVDVVSRDHRQGKMPDRRHVVADRNRLDHDLAAAGCNSDRARNGDAAAARNNSRCRQQSRRIGRRERRRLSGRANIHGRRCCARCGAMTRRYKQAYWSEIPGCYFAGDGARRDERGYFWIMGRVDDVINVSGHRLGTAEIESALVSHETVAEAAVVGRPDDLKGQAISAFVTLEGGRQGSDELKEALRAHVAKEIGALAKPDDIRFTDALPKTRSGKIMRRLLRELASTRAGCRAM